MNRVSRRSAAEAAEALLEVGRTEPVLDYDVELGLLRHREWLRHQAPMPEWASASAGAATKSLATVVIKAIVSTVVMGVLATAAWQTWQTWQARNLLQPSAAGRASAPAAVATQPAVPAATASEAEAALAPIPIPVPDQAAPSEHEHPARRAGRVDASDKRAGRVHRAHKATSAPTRTDSPAPAATPSVDRAAESSSEEHAAAARPASNGPVAAEHKPSEVQKPRPEHQPKAQQPEDLLEMQQVATAEQLLERSPARALTLVRQGDQRFARGYFQQERAYIAIMALIRLGRVDEARARAATFAKQFPALPYGARIRSALDAAAHSASGASK